MLFVPKNQKEEKERIAMQEEEIHEL